MTTRGNDQSASFRCPKHGRNAGAVFFRPESGDNMAADYVCLHCWLEAGEPLHLTPAEFIRLKYHQPPRGAT